MKYCVSKVIESLEITSTKETYIRGKTIYDDGIPNVQERATNALKFKSDDLLENTLSSKSRNMSVDDSPAEGKKEVKNNFAARPAKLR